MVSWCAFDHQQLLVHVLSGLKLVILQASWMLKGEDQKLSLISAQSNMRSQSYKGFNNCKYIALHGVQVQTVAVRLLHVHMLLCKAEIQPVNLLQVRLCTQFHKASVCELLTVQTVTSKLSQTSLCRLLAVSSLLRSGPAWLLPAL